MCRKGAVIIDRLCGIQLYWCVFILISFAKFVFLDVHYNKLFALYFIKFVVGILSSMSHAAYGAYRTNEKKMIL